MTDKCPKSQYKDDRHEWVDRLTTQEHALEECAGCGVFKVSKYGWSQENKNWRWNVVGYIVPS